MPVSDHKKYENRVKTFYEKQKLLEKNNANKQIGHKFAKWPYKVIPGEAMANLGFISTPTLKNKDRVLCCYCENSSENFRDCRDKSLTTTLINVLEKHLVDSSNSCLLSNFKLLTLYRIKALNNNIATSITGNVEEEKLLKYFNDKLGSADLKLLQKWTFDDNSSTTLTETSVNRLVNAGFFNYSIPATIDNNTAPTNNISNNCVCVFCIFCDNFFNLGNKFNDSTGEIPSEELLVKHHRLKSPNCQFFKEKNSKNETGHSTLIKTHQNYDKEQEDHTQYSHIYSEQLSQLEEDILNNKGTEVEKKRGKVQHDSITVFNLSSKKKRKLLQSTVLTQLDENVENLPENSEDLEKRNPDTITIDHEKLLNARKDIKKSKSNNPTFLKKNPLLDDSTSSELFGLKNGLSSSLKINKVQDKMSFLESLDMSNLLPPPPSSSSSSSSSSPTATSSKESSIQSTPVNSPIKSIDNNNNNNNNNNNDDMGESDKSSTIETPIHSPVLAANNNKDRKSVV
ncbi:uncharacterized protein SCODWIG_02938 [Saccharomycodes ludwigii]|uniref:Uncharacterized protein n=1 Tax=Saccharomycodes ludwigii TaxID=36035 RepID=A0A376B949_9ASCO|nr:uncharacterized protein SCODWIG_02938 [Saccharomycodes ludwigii]